ncbi:MAG: metal ABC transporter ATP-binding protein [Treponema sp.]|jgi:zinc transport system ATP-binding protein|nr:metal ABC transporter ATP-binding protein [Treponema sp.]
MDSNIAVRFDSVSFSYDDVQILENASFHIHRGEFAAMVGPNGSGKTTVLKLLLGLKNPGAGSIEIFNHSPGEEGEGSPRKAEFFNKANVAYVSQQMPADNLFPITVRDVVRMGLLLPFRGYSGNSSIGEAMEQAGIASLAAKPYSSLSGGQKRRTLVARALAAKPDLLVLDEPTANMDSESESRLYETLGAYKGKITILIVTHNTDFVTALTDRVLCLGDGSHSIVQHRTEEDTAAHHGSAGQEVRILHGENIKCC